MTAYNTEYIKEYPSHVSQPSLYLLENEIDFSEQNLESGDTVRLFTLEGVHVLKVMWEVQPCNAARTITLGDSADANDWSNNTDITCSTTVAVVGLSTANNGVGKSYIAGTDNYLLMTIGTGALSTGSIKVKALVVKM